MDQKEVEHLTCEMLSFKALESPTSRHIITSGKLKGWTMNTSLTLKRAIFEGMSQDGSPIIKISYVVISTPMPPEK